MNIDDFVGKMKKIQQILIKFLDDEINLEENYEIFVKTVTEQKINEDTYQLKSVFQLINKIGCNHQRCYRFFNKIEAILKHFKKDMLQYFTNSEIFEIFKDNKRILLFLFQEKIIIVDEYIVSQLTCDEFIKKKYIEYFSPEIKPFFNENFISKYKNTHSALKNDNFIQEIMKDVPEIFYEKRLEGENDNYICELIRLNKVNGFDNYINRNKLSFNSYIPKSIFETNSFLIDKDRIKLIEYAAFFGSNDIIKYMQINGKVKLTSSIWYYSIHSQSLELIYNLEINHVLPPFNKYETILKESIKCHHNSISDKIILNLIDKKEFQYNNENNFYDNHYRYAVEYHNYCFFPDMNYKNTFFYLCEFDYHTLVMLYLKEKSIDINAKIVKKIDNLKMSDC